MTCKWFEAFNRLGVYLLNEIYDLISLYKTIVVFINVIKDTTCHDFNLVSIGALLDAFEIIKNLFRQMSEIEKKKLIKKNTLELDLKAVAFVEEIDSD